jgi:hypothetical protein
MESEVISSYSQEPTARYCLQPAELLYTNRICIIYIDKSEGMFVAMLVGIFLGTHKINSLTS